MDYLVVVGEKCMLPVERTLFPTVSKKRESVSLRTVIESTVQSIPSPIILRTHLMAPTIPFPASLKDIAASACSVLVAVLVLYQQEVHQKAAMQFLRFFTVFSFSRLIEL
jgi:hypothetical protein